MNKRQHGVLSICWVSYVAAYLCRINMASALVKIESAFDTSGNTLGLIGSLFFVTYAVGQLINGIIGDRISPYKMLIAALIGTAALNLLVGFAQDLLMVTIYWTINGYVQSMFWGPLMRILSSRYSKEHNSHLSMIMNSSIVSGYAISWVVLGGLFAHSAWNAHFLAPSVITIIPIFAWFVVLLQLKEENIDKKTPTRLHKTIEVFNQSNLYLVVGVCICLGLIKEGVSLWAPVIMVKALGFSADNSFLFIILIPIFNFAGIVLARVLTKELGNKVGLILCILFGSIVISCAGLFFLSGISGLLGLIMLSLISGMTFGANSVLLSFIPLSFARHSIVSTLVGVFDFCSYMGAAISAFALGGIIEQDSWHIVPLLWAGVSISAILLSILYSFLFGFENKSFKNS